MRPTSCRVLSAPLFRAHPAPELQAHWHTQAEPSHAHQAPDGRHRVVARLRPSRHRHAKTLRVAHARHVRVGAAWHDPGRGPDLRRLGGAPRLHGHDGVAVELLHVLQLLRLRRRGDPVRRKAAELVQDDALDVEACPRRGRGRRRFFGLLRALSFLSLVASCGKVCTEGGACEFGAVGEFKCVWCSKRSTNSQIQEFAATRGKLCHVHSSLAYMNVAAWWQAGP